MPCDYVNVKDWVPQGADSEMDTSLQKFNRECSWDNTCGKEGKDTGLGREKSNCSAVSNGPQWILQDILKMGWLLSAVLSWWEGWAFIHLHWLDIDYQLPQKKGMTLGEMGLFGWSSFQKGLIDSWSRACSQTSSSWGKKSFTPEVGSDRHITASTRVAFLLLSF